MRYSMKDMTGVSLAQISQNGEAWMDDAPTLVAELVEAAESETARRIGKQPPADRECRLDRWTNEDIADALELVGTLTVDQRDDIEGFAIEIELSLIAEACNRLRRL
ncbi:MAG: hypothetical protein IT428_06745 [Planctomycetaceae bacterium]|nr:hypothetical protein [Planctomycetaceae bacterium]